MGIATLTPAILFIIVTQKKSETSFTLRMVRWFILLYFLSDLPLWITTGMNIHNAGYYYFRSYILYLLILGIYFFEIDNKNKKRILLLLIILLGILSVASLIVPVLYEIVIFYKLAVIAAIFMHFQTILSESKIKNLLHYPFFWVSSGILFYSCGTILIDLFGKYTLTNTNAIPLTKIFAQFSEFFGILMFIMIGVGFYVTPKMMRKLPTY